MNKSRSITLAIVVLIVLVSLTYLMSGSLAQSGVGSGPARTFYDLDVVAVSGQNGLTILFAAPSINDSGNVSFVGRTSGNNLFISDTPGSSRSLNAPGTNNTLSGNTQITNTNQIAALETIIGLNQQLLRIWDGNTTNTSTVAAGSTAAFNDFAAVRPNPSINNNGQPVFTAQQISTFQTLLVTGIRPNFNQLNLAHPLRPMIADNGSVVVRAGNTITSPILLYQFNLTAPVTIAATPDFTQLGDSPGISDDARVVVFFGDPAIVIDGSDEPGIFASIDEGGGARRLVRITGRTGELGHDAMGNPIRFNPNSSSIFNRVGVTHQELGPMGLDGDSFVVCFQAAPTAASPDFLFTLNNGLWTIRTDVVQQAGMFNYTPRGPIPVLQIGDVIDGRTVTDIVVNDSIANVTTNTINGTPRTLRRGENRVAFYASTNTADILVRGTYLDSDEDNLPDHWEARGINFSGNLIDLPAMGASATHKDLFIHADWMAANGGVTFQPRAAALKLVVDAFRRAPVTNPDGMSGIILHIDAGPNSVMDPRNNRRWSTRSRAGSVPYQQFIIPCNGGPPCQACTYDFTDLDNIKAIRFNPTRRGPVFHYALFANRYGLGDCLGGTSSGISRGIGASDFIVSLGAFTPAGGNTFQQAGTFFHELGHNLGLRHGGDANLPNNKPNYLSVMNYSFQLSGLIRTNGRSEYNYSTRLLPPLDENALNEAIGISDPDNHRTAWSDQNGIRRESGSGVALPAVDWFRNNMIDLGTVAVDINGNGGGLETGANSLRGFNDWPAIIFDGGGRIGTASVRGDTSGGGSNPSEVSNDELENLIPLETRHRLECSIEENVSVIPESGDVPLTVIFDASASTAPCGTIVSYSWDFGDGSMGNGVSVQHSYAAPGTYIASLSMTDDTGNFNMIQLDYLVVATPNGTCSYSISPLTVFFGPRGGDSMSVNVTAPVGCSWTASSNDSWINIINADNGNGNGTINYVVRENFTGGARLGTMTIAGETFVVIQISTNNCTYTLSASGATFSSNGGSGSITVTTSGDCAWQAVSDVGFISITSGSPTIGSGTVDFSVGPNPGPSGRKGKINIGGVTFNVKQTFP